MTLSLRDAEGAMPCKECSVMDESVKFVASPVGIEPIT
jgi:hypothetical protein